MKKCFKDFVRLKRGFDLPVKKRISGEIPVYSANGISGFHNTPSCPAPGVITGRSGTIGSVMYSQTPFWALNTTLFVEEFKGNVPRFVYYFLLNFDLSRFSAGAVVPTLNRNDFSDISIDVPEKDEQLRIASILGSLDEKIEINRKKIEKLEALARMIYEHWFVQFDFPDANGKPYKSSGGAMVWNEELKQEIPVGWGVNNLYYIAEYINGCACQKYYAKDGDDALPVVKIKEMHEGFSSETEYVKSSVPEKYKITAGDILFSWSASLEVMTWTGTDSCLNQHIFHVVPHNGFSPLYVLQQLQIYIRKFILFANARKTTMGHITADHIEQSRIVVPPNCLICEFSEKFEALYAEQIILQKEIQKLMSIRDWLLPMLMNGQVGVSA